MKRHHACITQMPPGYGPLGACPALTTVALVHRHQLLRQQLVRNTAPAAIPPLSDFAALVLGIHHSVFDEVVVRFCAPQEASALCAQIKALLGPELPHKPEELFGELPVSVVNRDSIVRPLTEAFRTILTEYARNPQFKHPILSRDQLRYATVTADTLCLKDIPSAMKHHSFMAFLRAILAHMKVPNDLWGLPPQLRCMSVCVFR